MYIKNTSGQSLGFCLVDSSGVAVTGASVTAKRSIDANTQANATGSVTELGNGQYCLCMSQADTNGDNITFLFTATGCVPREKTIVTCASTTAVKSIQKGTSGSAGTATITAVNTAKSFILSASKGSAGTVAATGSFSFVTTNGDDHLNFNGPVNDAYTANPSLSGGTTNLTTKQYSAVLTNSTTVSFDGPVEWQVVEFY